MSAKTGIQWTDATWSPLRVRVKSDAAEIARAKGYTSLVQIAEKMAGHVGPHCENVSHGCDHCYAGSNNHRCLPGNGTGLPYDRRSRDLVEAYVDEKILTQPLGWRKPKKIFVENQSDLFGDWNEDEQIAEVVGIMSLCPKHEFQVLTKRSERMLALFGSEDFRLLVEVFVSEIVMDIVDPLNRRSDDLRATTPDVCGDDWPLHNVWCGVSVEDQATADERSRILREVPAALRFISQEPQLSAINWKPGMLDGISWVIIGGESGHGARPFDIAWARTTIEACREAGVACFVKQVGSKPFSGHSLHKQIHDRTTDGNLYLKFNSRKGGDMSEWPEDIRVREFPS